MTSDNGETRNGVAFFLLAPRRNECMPRTRGATTYTVHVLTNTTDYMYAYT